MPEEVPPEANLTPFLPQLHLTGPSALQLLNTTYRPETPVVPGHFVLFSHVDCQRILLVRASLLSGARRPTQAGWNGLAAPEQ